MLTHFFVLSIYHGKKFIEIRQEAVQQALAAMQNKPKPSMPMPSKRTSAVMATGHHHHHRNYPQMQHSPNRRRPIDSRRQPPPPRTDSSTDDDDSILNESSSTASEREKRGIGRHGSKFRGPSFMAIDQSLPNSSDTSTHSSPAHERSTSHHHQQQQRYSHHQQQPALLPRVIGMHEHSSSPSTRICIGTPDSSSKHSRKSHIQSQPLPPPPTMFKNPSPTNIMEQQPKQQQQQQSSSLNQAYRPQSHHHPIGSSSSAGGHRMNGSQSQQSHLHSIPPAPAEYANDDASNNKVEIPPERPERVSSKISDVNHLADILQNLSPSGTSAINQLPGLLPDVTNTNSSSLMMMLNNNNQIDDNQSFGIIFLSRPFFFSLTFSYSKFFFYFYNSQRIMKSIRALVQPNGKYRQKFNNY